MRQFHCTKKCIPVTPSSIFEFKPKFFILEMEKFIAITVLSTSIHITFVVV